MNGKLINCCRARKDYAALTTEERLTYTNAVLTVAQDPFYKPRYDELIALYQESFENDFSQSSNPSTSQYFVFVRYFLLEYEDLLKDVNCSVTIPFYDWTPFPVAPYTAAVWSNIDGFGDTARLEDQCVITGPFQVSDFSITPSAGGGCLKRLYRNERFPSRDIVDRDVLPLPASEFVDFHRYLQLLLGSNVQCFIGGTICSVNAANDPIQLLHLAKLDSILTRWQFLGQGRGTVRYSADNSPLLLSPGFTVSQFSGNLNLPYGVCILYDPPFLLKNHAPPPTTLLTLGQPAVIATMDCMKEDMMSFMPMSDDDIDFMEDHCSRPRVFRSIPNVPTKTQ